MRRGKVGSSFCEFVDGRLFSVNNERGTMLRGESVKIYLVEALVGCADGDKQLTILMLGPKPQERPWA